MPSPVAELLGRIGSALASLGVRWYLFGAQAAIVHGAARLTADVDVTVEPGPGGPRALIAALGAAGLRPRVADPEGFAERTRVLPLADGPSGIPVDVVLSGPGIEEGFHDRARACDLDGTRVPVASAEDLLVMKVLSGRPRDLDDAAAILRAQQGRVDRPRVRDLLGEIERALDRSDLVAAFDALEPGPRA